MSHHTHYLKPSHINTNKVKIFLVKAHKNTIQPSRLNQIQQENANGLKALIAVSSFIDKYAIHNTLQTIPWD